MFPGPHTSAGLFQPLNQPERAVACRDVPGITEQPRRFVDLIAQHIRLTEANGSHSNVSGERSVQDFNCLSAIENSAISFPKREVTTTANRDV
jgi:hypothetical protein